MRTIQKKTPADGKFGKEYYNKHELLKNVNWRFFYGCQF